MLLPLLLLLAALLVFRFKFAAREDYRTLWMPTSFIFHPSILFGWKEDAASSRTDRWSSAGWCGMRKDK